MNKILGLAATVLALNVAPAFGQAPQAFNQDRPQLAHPPGPPGAPPAAAPATLTSFDLDFPGGSPSQLVQAIEKATGKPLNAIINHEDEDVVIPPLQMKNVVTPQLFAALEATSRKTVAVQSGFGGSFGNSYSQVSTSYGFTTHDGPVSDSSVWCFHVERPIMPPVVSTEKSCRFFSLSDYLNRGFTVDDITTAIRTGWKLAGETNPPDLNYHKETKLLIAYGEPSKLKTIQDVLVALPSSATHRQSEIDTLESEIAELKNNVIEIRRELPAPAPAKATAEVPQEKSGK